MLIFALYFLNDIKFKFNYMKKLFFILLAVGVMSACNTKKAEPQPEVAAPVTLEADVEQALQKNIELNEQVTTLDEELDAIINEQ